jgi:hypothetical protein
MSMKTFVSPTPVKASGRHTMVDFFLERPLMWTILSILPGGLFLFGVEFDARKDGWTRALPWFAALPLGAAFCFIIASSVVWLTGSGFLTGYLVAKSFAIVNLLKDAWLSRNPKRGARARNGWK